MNYLCLVYYQEGALDALSKHEHDALIADSLAYKDELRRSGHYIASQPLQGVRSATTIRHKDGKLLVTDGPFAETKEQLGGFFLVEARDLDEAIRIASGIPPGRLGSVEVRPIKEL